MATIRTKTRVKWGNYVNDQAANPLKFFKPGSPAELREILVDARTNGYKVKALGSGHSSSDVAICRDYMIDTHSLDKVLDIASLDLRPGVYASNLFFAEAGMRIHAVNTYLEAHCKALGNMGAYDGQTLAGVISTSTHGSGVSLGAFPAYVRAMLVYGEDGILYHIEPEDGISNGAARLEGTGPIKFVRNDKVFRAVGVSMGCMGVIYAVVLEVRDSYMLKETRDFAQWSEVRLKLADGVILRENRHLEVLVAAYPNQPNDYKCLVTRRNIAPVPHKSPLIPRGHRKIVPELIVRILPDVLIDGFMRFLVNHFPRLIPWMVQMEINTLTDRDYVDKSFKVLNLGKDNNLAAYSTEIALPARSYLAAVDKILEVVGKSVEEGRQYLTGPFSLRFVKTNEFFLSMQYGRPGEDFVCMIEFPTLSGTIGGIELLNRIESALYEYGGVPHWGQINHVGGRGHAAIDRLYPCYREWLQVYKELCPDGRFENDFTRRCGISANS